MTTATACAHPNIAFIKYWGDADPDLHLPASGSISMNLTGMFTRTRVSFDDSLPHDHFSLNDRPAEPQAQQRVTRLLDRVRELTGVPSHARVESWNNFPTGAGVASSASGFAALALAASTAAGMQLSEPELSRLARRGSGSACRSIPAGFVEWQPGTSDEDSFAVSIADPQAWDLVDFIAVVNQDEKPVSSSAGHLLAASSPFQAARLAGASHRLEQCRQAIHTQDIELLSRVVELDSNLMHAVMMTSTPPLFYWLPATVSLLQAIPEWRLHGTPVCYTVDAGPNVHVLCPRSAADAVLTRLQALPGVLQILQSSPGGAAWLEHSPA